MIAPKVAFKGNVVPLSLCRESLVILHNLVWIWVLSRVVLDVLDLLVKLTFEHADCIDWIFQHIVGEPRVELAQFIDRYIESGVFFSNEIVDLLSDLSLVQVVCNHGLHRLLGHCGGLNELIAFLSGVDLHQVLLILVSLNVILHWKLV